MSRHILNVYQFSPDYDWDRAVQWAQQSLKPVQDRLFAHWANIFILRGIEAFDGLTLQSMGWEIEDDDEILDVLNVLKKTDRSTGSFTAIEMGITMAMAPFGGDDTPRDINRAILFEHDGRVYAHIGIEHFLNPWLLGQSFALRDFSHSDTLGLRPDEVTLEDWRQRGETWASILDGRNFIDVQKQGTRIAWEPPRMFSWCADRLYALQKEGRAGDVLRHRVSWPSVADVVARSSRLSDLIKGTSWSYRAISSAFTRDYIVHLQRIEEGLNEDYNEARVFAEKYVLKPNLTLDDLFVPQCNFDRERKETFAKMCKVGLPKGLITPRIEQKILTHHTRDLGKSKRTKNKKM